MQKNTGITTLEWAERKGYHRCQDKAIKIYALAKEGIPTVSSSTPSTKMLVQEAVRVLREVDNTLMTISGGSSAHLPDTFPKQDIMNGDTHITIQDIGDI